MNISTLKRSIPEVLLLLLVFVTILWKGGKALDSVWALAFIASFLVLAPLFFRGPDAVSHEKNHQSNVVWFLLFGFVILTLLSFIFSTTRNYGLDEVLQTVSLTLIFFSVGSCTRAFRSHFLSVVSIALLLACVIGGATYVLQPVSRFVGSFFDYRFHTDYWPNAWAEFVLLAWPMLLSALFLRSHSSGEVREDIVRSFVLGVVLGCFSLSYSRGATIALLMQILLLAGYFVIRRKFLLPWKRLGMIAVIIVLAAYFVFSGINDVRSRFHTVESVLEKVTFTSAEGASSVSERSQFFAQSLHLAQVRPLIGLGPYSFRFVQPHVQTEILATSDHPHNVFLKFAMERGILAALLFTLFLLFVLYRGFHSLVTAAPKSQNEYVTLVLLLSSVGVLLHNLIDYNLQFVGIVVPLWICFALLSHSVSKEKKQAFVKPAILAIVGVLLLFCIVYEGKNLAYSSSARRAERRGDDSAALRLYALATPTVFPRDALLSQGAMLLNTGRFLEAENAATEYLVENPQDARPWRLLGDIYLAWGKIDDAVRAYEKAFDYGRPNDAGILRGLMYVLRRDPAKLKERRHELDSLLNDYGLAILENTHFIALSSSVEEAVSAANLLARSFPEDSALYKEFATRIQEHADTERAKYSSRPRGLLW